MNENHHVNAIDLASVQSVTKRVMRNPNRTRSREIYCADFSTKQCLIAIKTTSGSESHVCCDLNIDNGACLNTMPVDDKYFGLLKKKYHQMKADSR